MKKTFYHNLANVDEIMIVVDEYEVKDVERNHLLHMIENTLHHRVIDTILAHLPKHHHESFLARFTKEPEHKDLLIFIKDQSEVDIEEKIRNTAVVVQTEILSDFQSE